MKKKHFLKEQQKNRILEDSGISLVSSADLISVDIQPAYEKVFTFDLYSFMRYINKTYDDMNSLTFLFNGPDLGYPDENEYKWWLIENGLDENIVMTANFYDKGYAFFRYCMDEGIDDDEIVNLIKFMMSNNINDSRDIDEDMWIGFMREYNYEQSEIRDLLEVANDMINIPELMDFLKKFQGKTVLCGGGINECLKEVEIALMALGKNYNILTKFTY